MLCISLRLLAVPPTYHVHAALSPRPAAVGVQAAADTSLALGVMLNEASTVYHVLVPHPSVMPTPAQVRCSLD